jgi:hypothetical protein
VFAADANAPHLRPYTKEGRFLGDKSLEGRDQGSEDVGTRALCIISFPYVPHEFSIRTKSAKTTTMHVRIRYRGGYKTNVPSHDLHRQNSHPLWSRGMRMITAIGNVLSKYTNEQHEEDLGFCLQGARELFEEQEHDTGAAQSEWEERAVRKSFQKKRAEVVLKEYNQLWMLKKLD